MRGRAACNLRHISRRIERTWSLTVGDTPVAWVPPEWEYDIVAIFTNSLILILEKGEIVERGGYKYLLEKHHVKTMQVFE